MTPFADEAFGCWIDAIGFDQKDKQCKKQDINLSTLGTARTNTVLRDRNLPPLRLPISKGGDTVGVLMPASA
jgi:hypothetical protein